jgi:hypothetical protein
MDHPDSTHAMQALFDGLGSVGGIILPLLASGDDRGACYGRSAGESTSEVHRQIRPVPAGGGPQANFRNAGGLAEAEGALKTVVVGVVLVA